MSIYDSKLEQLINNFKNDVAAITIHQNSILILENIKAELDACNIDCRYVVTPYADRRIGIQIYIITPFDEAITDTLKTTLLHLKTSHESIVVYSNISDFIYGYEIKSREGIEFFISLNELKNQYSPLHLDRLLEELKQTAPATDHTAEDVAEVAA